MSPRPTLRVVLDFDGTLTRNDTLEQLATIAYTSHGAASADESDSSAAPKSWAALSEAYLKDFEAHASAYTPCKEDRTTVAQEAEWLESLRSVEEASMARVDEDGLFKRVTKDDIASAAREAVRSGRVSLRSGWGDLISHVVSFRDSRRVPATFDILSVNWSREWIRCCMRYAAEAEGEQHLVGFFEHTGGRKPKFPSMEIHANEICGFHSMTEMKILTSKDKLQYLISCNVSPDSDSDSDTGRSLNIYVGDSTTDFECILAAHVGVCIRDEPMRSGQRELSETFKRLNIEVGNLATFNASDANDVLQDFKGLMENSDENGSNSVPYRSRCSRAWWIKDFSTLKIWLERWASHCCVPLDEINSYR